MVEPSKMPENLTASPAVLLTTVCRPFGADGDGDSVGAELFHAQVTRAQGVFSFRQVIRCWALDYLAENIKAPCVTLHYPSQEELIAELAVRRYGVIGINFVVATFHKVREMVPLIRRHAPQARILLGGYGTVLPDDVLRPWCDDICREEGVSYLRAYLGEPVDRPIAHPYAPIPSPTVLSYPLPSKVAHVTAGLGCPNGCDFCCTSHFFKRRYVPFVQSGHELHEIVLRMDDEASRRGEQLSGFIIIDEDFFLHETRAREYLERVRLSGRGPSLMGFGSVKGLSRFSADEIAEMGFHTIWVAYEGSEAPYAKLTGRPVDELYADLRSRGVAVLASMIIGFPYQDREVVLREFEALMAARPTYTQFLIYFAFPGTPLHERLVAEGGFLPEHADNPDWRTFDGFSLHLRHPAFSPDEAQALQRHLYARDHELLGPSVQRIIETFFEGWKNLHDSPNELLRQRAGWKKDYVRRSLPGLYAAWRVGPSRASRRRAKMLFDEITAAWGGLGAMERLRCWAAIGLAAVTWIAQRTGIGEQPSLLRTEHRLGLRSADAAPRGEMVPSCRS